MDKWLEVHDAIGYLQGIFDGEGTPAAPAGWMGKKGQPLKLARRKITLSNSDLELLEIVEILFAMINIVSRIEKSYFKPRNANQRPGYKLAITRQDNLIKFRDSVGFRNDQKHEALVQCIESYQSPADVRRRRKAEAAHESRARRARLDIRLPNPKL